MASETFSKKLPDTIDEVIDLNSTIKSYTLYLLNNI